MLAHPIVVRDDPVAAADAVGAREVGAAQHPGRVVVLGRRQLRGQRGDLLRQRAAEHRDHVQQAPRAGAELREPRGQHLVEGRAERGPVRRAGVARQLVQEQRVPAGVGRDPIEGRRVAIGQEQAGQLARLVGGSSSTRRCSVGARSSSFASSAWRDGSSTGRIVAISRTAGASSWARKLLQQHQAVRVGPVQVVDVPDQAPALGQAREQLAQRAEHARAAIVRIGHVRDLGRQRDRLHPPQDREQSRQQRGAQGHQLRHLHWWELAEVAGERVGDAVERLVRHDLALVAAPGQHHRVGRARGQLLEEPLDELALAHPGHALDEEDQGRVAAALVAGVQPAQLVAAADEGGLVGRAAAGRPAVDRQGRRGDAQAREDVADRRARAGQGLEQLDAQRVEIRRHRGDELPRWRRHDLLLLHEDLERRAPVVRERAGQRLEQDDPDAVPVGRGADVARQRLLGGHVGDRADDLAVARSPHVVLRAGDQAKVEDDDPPRRGHQDVRGLEVAVHLAGRVQRGDPQGELLEPRAQPGLVEALAADMREEVHAPDQLHRVEGLAKALEELVQRDQVGVRELVDRAELALEPQEAVPIDVAQGLERDQLTALAVVGLVDHAHRARAQRAPDLEACACVEPVLQGWCRRQPALRCAARRRGPG